MDRAAPIANVYVYNIDVADSNINVSAVYIYGRDFFLDQTELRQAEIFLLAMQIRDSGSSIPKKVREYQVKSIIINNLC
ncbi:MAG: hypothetical protein AAGF35_15545, partial [Pseudomonadota bacterium]